MSVTSQNKAGTEGEKPMNEQIKNEVDQAFVKKYYGRRIIAAEINDECLIIVFEDGVKIKLWDDGQSCCEHRFITCDDDVSCLIGGRLLKIDVKKGGSEILSEYGHEREWCFVDVITTEGMITMTTHNKHNGSYSGFDLSVVEI